MREGRSSISVRSLRGKSQAYLEALVRDGWYIHSYKHCREGCGALPWPKQ